MKYLFTIISFILISIWTSCSPSSSEEISTQTFTTSLSTTSINFGNIEVALTSEKTFSVINTGTETINISNITTPIGFNITPTNTNINTGTSKIFSVNFSPTTNTVYNGNIVITSNSNSTASIISLSGTGIASTSDRKTYDNTIAPIINQSCATTGCHSGANPAGQVPLTTFSEVKIGFTVDGSWGEILSGRMPKSGVPALSTEDKGNLLAWINADYPSEELTPATFDNDISQIVNQSCATSGCHDSNSTKAGVNLSSYALVASSFAGNGWLEIENKTMPKNGSLTVSEIAIIKNWIDNDFIQQ